MTLSLDKIVVRFSFPIIIGAYVVYRIYENQTKKQYIDLERLREAGL